MVKLKRLIQYSILAVGSIFTITAHADSWFYLDPIRLEAEIRFEGSLDETKTGASGEQQNSYERTTLLLQERVSIGLSGFVFDPKIGTFSIDLTPVFRQGRESVNNEDDGSSGRDLDYNINLGILQGSYSPVEGSLSTFRITSTNDIAFGSQNKSDVSEHNLGLIWKNDWMPLQFSYRAGSYLQEYTRLGGFRSRREETRQVARLQGRSSKLAVTLDHETVNDKVFDRDYSLSRAILNHKLHWGRNSGLYSTIRFFDRQGFNEYQQIGLMERLRISHTDNLSSNTSYNYFSQESLTKISNHEGFFQLDHSLYNNLNSMFRIRGKSEKSDSLKRDEIETGASTFYQKSFQFGRVTAGLSGDYRRTDRESEAGLGEIINEEHTASFTEQIILRQQLIEASTIQVAAADEFIYSEGLDYVVLPIGGSYTEIRVLPGGRITAGETLLVNYLYQLLPSARFNSVSAGYSFSYSYRWMRFYHSANRFTHRLIDGFGEPPDQKNRVTGVELSLNHSRVSARFSAESRFRQYGDFRTTAVAMNQTLGFDLSDTLDINLSGNQIFTDSSGVVTANPFESPGELSNESSTEYYAFDMGLTWFPRSKLTIVPSIGVWRSKERFTSGINPNVDRLYFNANLRVSWQVRQLIMDFFYSHNTSDVNGTDRIGDRLYFSVRRRFR
jgi:hypothetical protein